jgi:hypothetical protein
MVNQAKLKVGFIIDGDQTASSYYELIDLLIKNNDIFDSPIIISQIYDLHAPGLRSSNQNFISKFLHRLLYSLIVRIERLFLKRNLCLGGYGQTCSTMALNLKKVMVHPIISLSGSVHSFAEKDLKRIEDEQCHIFIRCGRGILKGKILSIAEFGIISFHHGNNKEIRGMPAGFWEVYLDWPSTGFIIQQLTEKLDDGNVLFRGSITTASYWQLNAARINYKSKVFLFDLLKDIAKDHKLPEFERRLLHPGKIFTTPSLKVLFNYFCSNIFNFISNKFWYFLGYRHRWSVSYVQANGINSSLEQGTTIQNPENGFLADPFVISMNNADYCFVEDYSYEKEIGKISCYKISESGYESLGTAIEENFHLSFPYIFKFEENLYMCPETAQINEIRIYKCLAFPNQWALDRTLMKDVSAADSVIFPFQSKWFLLTNICSSHMGDRSSELHLFSASNPLSNKWLKCDSNPIVFDAQKARNGGFFMIDGKPYRVNQKHNKSKYGVGFSINAIETIGEHFYSETEVLSIEPTFFKDLSGAHHLHMNENFCVYDHSSFQKVK